MVEAKNVPRRSFEIIVTKAENDPSHDDLQKEEQKDCLNPRNESNVKNFLLPNIVSYIANKKYPQEIQKYFRFSSSIINDSIKSINLVGDKQDTLESLQKYKTPIKNNSPKKVSCTCSII